VPILTSALELLEEAGDRPARKKGAPKRRQRDLLVEGVFEVTVCMSVLRRATWEAVPRLELASKDTGKKFPG
jgi:hypothetical protein